MIFKEKTKSLPISKQMVWEAYKKVKANQGSSGVDKVNWELFDQDLSKRLYKLWNRLSSGSYFPPAVREVAIPKVNGKMRKLGIPTISDRIAQEVIKSYLEPRLEKLFHPNSYGYRPMRSAHQAVEEVRKNVRNYAWVIDLDIANFFDEVSHELMMRALESQVSEKWVKMYIRRWLEAPVEREDGTQYCREGKGTPQGGVISPLLANLYLHYTLDKWIEKHLQVSFVRYADDIIIHVNSSEEAEMVLSKIRGRLQACKLSLNETKTKIVYCQDYRREKLDMPKQFDFLGFSFQPRPTKSWRDSGHFLGYDCAISTNSIKRIAKHWKSMKINRWTNVSLQEIANRFNPMIRGIINYYGKFKKWVLERLFRIFNVRLAKWVLNKYKRFGKSYKKAYEWLRKTRDLYPTLFYHWQHFRAM